MTPEETIVWDRLRGNKLNGLHFRRQQVIAGYIADFYCHSARLIVEIDGEIHTRQKNEDQKRDRILMEKGLKVLRIQNKEVQADVQKVLEVILQACNSPGSIDAKEI
jgi:very-short-patch-repair endonuclease